MINMVEFSPVGNIGQVYDTLITVSTTLNDTPGSDEEKRQMTGHAKNENALRQ